MLAKWYNREISARYSEVGCSNLSVDFFLPKLLMNIYKYMFLETKMFKS